jgi:hypothetical protein
MAGNATDSVATTALVVIVGLVGGVLALATRRAFHHVTPLVFHCRRCDREFLRKAYARFPSTCPHCHSRDWNRSFHPPGE